MINPGLLSVTFRSRGAEQIVQAASKAGLAGIEWGGDIHVPAGKTDVAKVVASTTRDAGLRVSAYGSYYRLGSVSGDSAAAVIDSAFALGAPVVRVWAGTAGSVQTTQAERHRIVEDTHRFCDLAGKAKIRVATEWHGETLTDTAESAIAFFNAVNHPNLYTYWQPPQRMNPDDCLADLNAALPRLAGIHVFQWHVQTCQRQALEEGDGWWPRYLSMANQQDDLFASLEFVRDDSLEQMYEDTNTLQKWLAHLNKKN